MQKNILKNNKGSILIWAMFLLLFISFSFIYISIQIRYQISRQSDIISDLINFNYEIIGTGTSISLEDGELYTKQYINTFRNTLGDNDIDTFSLSDTQTFTISTDGYLRLFVGTDDPIVFNGDYIYSTGTTDDIKLQSVSGYSKYSITFEDGEKVIFPYNYIKVYKKVGSYNLLKYTKLVK